MRVQSSSRELGRFVFLLALVLHVKACDLRADDRTFTMAAALTYAATVADIETTMAALRTPGVQEGNPIMRPFVDSRPEAYGVSLALTTGSLVGAKWLKDRGVRRWWLVPLAMAGAHGVAAARNIGNVREMRGAGWKP